MTSTSLGETPQPFHSTMSQCRPFPRNGTQLRCWTTKALGESKGWRSTSDWATRRRSTGTTRLNRPKDEGPKSGLPPLQGSFSRTTSTRGPGGFVFLTGDERWTMWKWCQVSPSAFWKESPKSSGGHWSFCGWGMAEMSLNGWSE